VGSPPDFKVDANRDATDSIRGYVYQAYQSVLAWIQLKDNEILVLEGAEDFDIHEGASVTTIQVKDVSSKLTLRSQSIVDSLNNHWDCQEKNPDFDINFRFLTTANAGQEKGSPFGPDCKGLEYWQKTELDHIDIEPLKDFLLTLKLNSALKSFLKTATDTEIREKLICRIKWDLGNKPSEAIEYNIESNLKNHGFKLHINSHYSCQVLPHLLKFVADLLSTKGMKELRFSDFLSCFDEATTLSIPRGQMEAIMSGGSQNKLAGMSEMVNLESMPLVIGRPIPIVDGGIYRSVVVSTYAKLLRELRVLFLSGSSGLGKTNLASLLSHEIGGLWGWSGFRGMQPIQVKHILARAAFEMKDAQLSPFLVLDDIDFSQVVQFEHEFISLVFAVINANGMVIITGPTRPPLQLLPKLWRNEDCEVTVPYFDETEIEEMVRTHGLSEEKRISEWGKVIWLATSGHPQLVHARVRSLSSKNWPIIGLSDISKPDDVERVRSEARSRLVEELPNENARALAYRLSLINGVFSRETAIAVARSPTSINLPGEIFDLLVGPWVEREEKNRYRISPLLTGAANSVLSETEIKEIHRAVALSILGRKDIDQFEVGTALFHAYMAKDDIVLMKLAYNITTIDSRNTLLLYNAMRWFTFISLEKGQKILPENPGTDLMLRLVQYKLIASSPEPDEAINIIGRIEETLNEIEPPEFKQHSEALAYGLILNTIDVPIPSAMTIRLISRMIDLVEDNPDFKEITSAFEKGHDDIPLIGDNKPSQVLFSMQGSRLTGLNDLSELISALDSLPQNKRDELLQIFSSEIDFASLLVNRAWWIEIQDGVLDVDKALKVFEFTVTKSREWNVPELTVASLVAMSVIQDEYGDSIDDALEIIEAAGNEFPDNARLINQQAKVLFHANRDSEALPIANKALALSDLSNVEYVYCCRSAGIAAATLGDWLEAERLFLLGASKAKESDFVNNMGTGFMADAAFALWKQGKHEDSLLLFADTLDSLEKITLSEDIRVRYLHATVRHSISWIHTDALETHSSDLVEPNPGMCSNQEPNEGIKEHHIVDLSAAWELLAITEQILMLDVGIKERVQAATGGNKPAIVGTYRSLMVLDSVFKKKTFEDLIPQLITMLEALNHSKALEENNKDEWKIGDAPKLPDGYWDNSGNYDIVYHFLLTASVNIIADNRVAPLLVDKWRDDLKSAGALSNDIDQFLDVLKGDEPNNSLYQQVAAAAIIILKNGVLEPSVLWVASFRLVTVLMNDDRWVESALERLLITRWLFSINNQRFAFIIPAAICPEIEKHCLDKSLNGFAKIATILSIAAPSLNIPLSEGAKKVMKKIIEKSN